MHALARTLTHTEAARAGFHRGPTFLQTPSHFVRLVAQPRAVGEIQGQAGFRERVLRLLVIQHQPGGAVHGALDLQGEQEGEEEK